MNLHENQQLFRQAVQAASDRMQIPAIYVEKDYWVTYALHLIFHHDIGKETIFKGGTALSKCFDFIKRFSEDVDLVVLRNDGDTDNQLKSKLKKISNLIKPVLPEIDIEGLTRKRGMNRKTVHVFPKSFKGDYGQIREQIILESTWLGNYEPYEKKTITSLVGAMMLEVGQEKIVDTYGLRPFSVLVLSANRTMCEKIMSLVRFSYGSDPITDLKNKVRHVYDLHQLLQHNQFSDFMQSEAFDCTLIQVGQDDFKGFRNNNEWLNVHPSQALIFKDTEQVWGQLKGVYRQDFKKYLYGTDSLPDEDAILETLVKIRKRLETISWPEFRTEA